MMRRYAHRALWPALALAPSVMTGCATPLDVAVGGHAGCAAYGVRITRPLPFAVPGGVTRASLGCIASPPAPGQPPDETP